MDFIQNYHVTVFFQTTLLFPFLSIKMHFLNSMYFVIKIFHTFEFFVHVQFYCSTMHVDLRCALSFEITCNAQKALGDSLQ